MNGKLESILAAIGNTPVVRLNKLSPPGCNLFVKVESFNPMGSVKDRLALGIIEDAERRGALTPGQTVIEATSGNTGIGLAMVCAQKGYPLVVTMAENFSVERRKLMRFLGAKVVLTPAGAARARACWPRPRNWPRRTAGFCAGSSRTRPTPRCTRAPRRRKSWTPSQASGSTTGSPAIGTGGTLKGVSRVLKAQRPRHPGDRLRAGQFAGARQRHRVSRVMPRRPHQARAIPSFRPHLMQGWSPDFIPQLTEDAIATEADRPHRADQRRGCAAAVARTGPAGRHLRRHLGGATLRWRVAGLRRRRRRARTSCACCPTPANAT